MRLHPILLLAALAPACGPAPEPVAAPEPAPPATTAAPAPPPAAPVTVKRVVLSHGRPSGSSVTTVAPDGAVSITLDVLQNGRGPHVEATVRRAADGTIAGLTAKGHHTFGAPVDETFTREGGHARWKSREEGGEAEVSGASFFVPISPLPETLGMLAEALARAGGAMPLLPAGEARMARTGESTVRSAAGVERRLSGVAITGLDLTPTRLWMNEDGTFFGMVAPWFSLVPEGFEGAVQALIDRQSELDRAADQKLAADEAHRPPAAGLAFTHARVLDVEHGKWLPDQTVVVSGGTIASVGQALGAKIPAGAEVVDLAGKALLPGLWDMHVHLGDADGALHIASGVTTVRDVGNDPDKLDDWKKRFDDGSAVGPHVIRFGFVEGRNPKAASSKVTAETEDEARAAVALFAGRGYDGIKIYNSVRPELVPLIAREAHARGLKVTGHIPVHMLAHEAVAAGYDGIEHVNMLFLNFFATHETDTRDTTRFTLVGDKAAAFDLKSKPALDFFKLLRDHHTVVDPTCGAFEDLLVGQQGKIVPGLEGLVARLPVQAQRGFLTGGLPSEGKEALYRASYDKLLAMVKALHDAKVHVVVGTDALAGLMLHHELSLYVRAGLSTADTLKAATIEAARAVGMEKKSGSIARGKAADLVIVDGDPLAHVEDAGKVVSTVRGGVVFASAPLYRAAGVRPAK